MCGIIGVVSLSDQRDQYFSRLETATDQLQHRGPDAQKHVIESPVALGHTRLSIIDLEERAHQPMTDLSGRYTIVFNGEIYNFRELRAECIDKGYSFKTESDTEVLLVLFMMLGRKCLDKLHGFFAFAVYDREERSIFLARDRFGIKPVVYYADENTFAFASEMRGLMSLGFKREIDKVSLFNYFKLNYIPAPHTILVDHHKLEPGNMIRLQWDDEGMKWENTPWYSIPYDAEDEKELNAQDYKHAQSTLKRFVRESVRRRLVADVPLGTFLSGGIDSSIISAVAAQEKPDITAFSIGYPDLPYYDESDYARAVAKHIGIDHHVFNITQRDLFDSAESVLNHLDEPFADSSAMNVNLLSKLVRQHVTVALSGDGGDELFGGYHKHAAEFKLRYPTFREHAVGRLDFIWNQFPASRSGTVANTMRQLQKFSAGYRLGKKDRYWRWAGVMTEEQANYLIKEEMLPREQRLSDDGHQYKRRKDRLLRAISKGGSLNEVLLTDMRLVLPNDMLFKVDHMSMAHGLEVRTPMLDQNLVKFAFRLPVMFKVNHTTKKKILQDAFRDVLPPEVFSRPKRGFEVPLLEWFQGEMRHSFDAMVKDEDFLHDQSLLNPEAIRELHKKLYSRNPGDTPASAWALLVFQHWYKRYMS